MTKKISSSIHYGKMLQFVAPLNDRFGINHFWYYKITHSGSYSHIGTHEPWVEYFFDNSMLQHSACLRHPECLQRGINLMKTTKDKEHQKITNVAWEKFKINFNINLIHNVPEGIEAFGFATRFNDPYTDQLLLSNLPHLCEFIKSFKENHGPLLSLAHENQVHLPSLFGQKYYEHPRTLTIPFETNKLVNITEFKEILSLTDRERDILKFIASGHPKLYIAARLNLSKKTVENYLSSIKYKLSCGSTLELLQKAQKIESTSFFDL